MTTRATYGCGARSLRPVSYAVMQTRSRSCGRGRHVYAGAMFSPLSPDLPRPLVLDGGLGTHLATRGNDVTDALWSARILLDRPSEVRAAHADFFEAGADVATACSYQVSEEALAQVGEDPRGADELLRRSVRLAREAADTAGVEAPRLVAASLGPYGAVPGAPGTEYDGAYVLETDDLARFHRPRIAALVDAGPDLLLVETVPSVREAEALAGELAGVGLPVWFSLTVSGGRLRDGTGLAEVVDLLAGVGDLAAIGVNCCAPADAVRADAELAGLTELPRLAYPNSGEAWDHVARVWTPVSTGPMAPGEPRTALEAARCLVATGTAVVGGCCRVGPEEIAEITDIAHGRSEP